MLLLFFARTTSAITEVISVDIQRYRFDGIYKYATLMCTMLSSATQHGSYVLSKKENNKMILACLVEDGSEYQTLLDNSIEAAHKADELDHGKHDPLYYC